MEEEFEEEMDEEFEQISQNEDESKNVKTSN